jgi:signal peptidase I
LTLIFENNITVMDVLDLKCGEYRSTPNITLQNREGEACTFCVLLFPFGCDPGKSRRRGGFGMSYAPVPFPLFQNNEMTKFQKEKLMLYLQFIPSSTDQTADVSFSMRLRGQQTSARRFDLQWQAGMRFVHPSRTQLDQGQAHDFGTSLMRSDLITSFWEETEPIQVQLDLQIHTPPHRSSDSKRKGLTSLRDLRRLNKEEELYHDPEQVRVGRVVVPVLTNLSQRPRMFELGVYPGVEYRIMRIRGPSARMKNGIYLTSPETTEDLFYSRPGALYDLKPMYPLVRQLERPWPVTVSEMEIPRLYTPGQYNIISALGSVMTAVAGLALAFLVSQGISLYYIPSRSMEPTLQVGDVLLVEKISPRINRNGYHAGEIVLFHPPSTLQDLVTRSGGRVDDRDLFVKRIAAEPGDRFRVDPKGLVQITTPSGARREHLDLCPALTEVEPLGLLLQYLPPKGMETQVPPNQWEVLGDCGAVSIDSRVWGALPTENIVGRPLMRLWPRLGTIPPLPESLEEDRK